MKKGLLFSKLCARLPEETYLVGGFVRDTILKKVSYDLDFVVPENEKRRAHEIARDISGTAFPLDESLGIWRVVRDEWKIDISRRTGKNMEEDLARRDFTINALAVPLSQIRKFSKNDIMDPCGGLSDLAKKRIRMVREHNFADDPLRVLRAYRFAAILRFRIDPETEKSLKKYFPRMAQISGERIKEEMNRLFAADKSAGQFRELYKSGLLEALFPELRLYHDDVRNYFHKDGLWGHSYYSLVYLEKIFLKLHRFFPRCFRILSEYFDTAIEGGTPRKILLKWAVVLHDLGKPSTIRKIGGRVRFFAHEAKGSYLAEKIMERIKASRKEKETVAKLIFYHMRPGNLLENEALTDRAVYRFFRDLGDEALSLLMLSWADRLSYIVVKSQKNVMELFYRKLKKLIYRYYFKKEKVTPVPLLDGTDIMKILSLPQGPRIGEIKKNLLEAQAVGRVKTKEEAVLYVQRHSQ